MAAFVANCLHGLEALGPGGLWAVMGALFLAGLAGGATHCAAMCGPFVLAQAAAAADRSASGGVLRRLSGAALAPYHLGRALGYGLLGALAGGVVGAVSLGTGWRLVLAAMLAVAALLMFAQASARIAALLPRFATPRLPCVLEARLGPLLVHPRGCAVWRLACCCQRCLAACSTAPWPGQRRRAARSGARLRWRVSSPAPCRR